MRPLELTRDLANAAAVDAARRQMRKAGRAKMNYEDWSLYCQEFDRLWAFERDIEDARAKS